MGNGALGLQRMTESCQRQAKVLAVTSGRGEVGKSNIAANLAICLACSQKRIVLLDADSSLGNLDVIMGLRSKYNISHMIDGRRGIEQIIHIGTATKTGRSGLSESKNYFIVVSFGSETGQWSGCTAIR